MTDRGPWGEVDWWGAADGSRQWSPTCRGWGGVLTRDPLRQRGHLLVVLKALLRHNVLNTITLYTSEFTVVGFTLRVFHHHEKFF